MLWGEHISHKTCSVTSFFGQNVFSRRVCGFHRIKNAFRGTGCLIRTPFLYLKEPMSTRNIQKYMPYYFINLAFGSSNTGLPCV